jgi:hypothetical protein
MLLSLWRPFVGARRIWLQQPINSRVGDVKLGDGCRHVFLDVGSNRGLHVRYLMEGRAVFPQAWYIDWVFDKTFGPQFVNDTTICAFAFEPNPLHGPRLQQLSMRLRASGRRVEIFGVAAYNRSGNLTFQRSADDLQNRGYGGSGWGFAAVSSTTAGAGVVVPTIDLASFVKAEIVGRRVPPPPTFLNAIDVRPPSVAMKMDIEGAELVVLEHMRNIGVLCELRIISFEYHPSKLYADGTGNPNSYAAHRDIFELINQRAPHTQIGMGSKPGLRWGRLSKVMDERTASAEQDGRMKAEQECLNTTFLHSDYEGYALATDVTSLPLPASVTAI